MIEPASPARSLGATSFGSEPREKHSRSTEVLAVIVLGVVAGELGLALGSAETRWLVYVLGAVFLLPAVAFAPRRERLLTTFFFISMQFDVSIRFLYGRAGTGGLAFPMCVLIGGALWAQIRYVKENSSYEFVWLGELRKPILATLGTTCIALIFSGERFAGLSRLTFELQLLLMYSLALNVVRRENGIARSMQLLAIMLGIQSTICIIQSRLGVSFSLLGEVTELGAVPRPGGTVSTNPAGFASFIMPAIMLLTARFVSQSSETRHRSDGIVVLLGITAIVLTFTRAAWVGLVLGLGYLTVVGFRKRYITLRKVMTMAAIATVIFMCAFPLMQMRLQSESNSDTYDERARLNAIAIDIILENPVFGLGPGAYEYRFKDFIGSDWNDQDWISGVHNEYLLRSAETGIVGGLAFVWLLFAALRQARGLTTSPDQTTRLFGLGWSAGLLALAWQMYWVPWRGFSYNSMLWLILGLSDGLASLQTHGAKTAEGERDDGQPAIAYEANEAGTAAR